MTRTFEKEDSEKNWEADKKYFEEEKEKFYKEHAQLPNDKLLDAFAKHFLDNERFDMNAERWISYNPELAQKIDHEREWRLLRRELPEKQKRCVEILEEAEAFLPISEICNRADCSPQTFMGTRSLLDAYHKWDSIIIGNRFYFALKDKMNALIKFVPKKSAEATDIPTEILRKIKPKMK
jgi:hypothetical protein